MAQPQQPQPQRKAAPAQQTATEAQQREKLFTLNEVTHHLVVARPVFESVVQKESLPLLWDSELAFARDLVMADEYLRRVVPETLAGALRNIAHVGLTLNPIKQHCKIIARWNKDAKVFEAHFLAMYRGLVYLATQAGVHDIGTDVVYKTDDFKIGRSSDGDTFTHSINVMVPRGGEDNPFIGAWVSAKMPSSGQRKVEWVPAADIHRMREQSDSYKDGQGNVRPNSPWVKWFDEQAKKSAIKRASKRWEEAIYESSQWQRFQTAVDLDHKAEGGGITVEGRAIPVDEPKLTIEQIAEIEAAASQMGVKDVNKYLAKICGAYGVGTLSEVPAAKHKEVLERLAVAKAEADKIRKAKGE
jgi:recombinational DNA repair protein RecT